MLILFYLKLFKCILIDISKEYLKQRILLGNDVVFPYHTNEIYKNLI